MAGQSSKSGTLSLDDVLNMLAACDRIDFITARRLKVSADKAKTAMRVIAMAAFSGLRKSEIQGCAGRTCRTVRFRYSEAPGDPTIIETTKTTASADSVPVLPIFAYLEAHRNGFPPDGHIFVGEKMRRPLDLHKPCYPRRAPDPSECGYPVVRLAWIQKGSCNNTPHVGSVRP